MGEIAEMMLDGTLCSQCGEYLDGADTGFPTMCAGCADDDDPHFAACGPLETDDDEEFMYITCIVDQGDVRIYCDCGKELKSFKSLMQHMRDKHGVE